MYTNPAKQADLCENHKLKKQSLSHRYAIIAVLFAMLAVLLPQPVAAGIYEADSPTAYKEYWVDHSEFTGGHVEADLPNCVDTKPQGNSWYLEPWADCEKIVEFTIADDFSEALRAEIYVDLWRNREARPSARFKINSSALFKPEVGNNWSRTPYIADVPLNDLKQGTNRIRFWGVSGPYHIHDVAIRIYHDADNPLRTSNGNVISAPDGALVSVVAPNGLFAADAGGTLQVDNDFVVLTADVTTPGKFVEFHAYYDGYDEDNDGVTHDWHNLGRNNWHPGGWLSGGATPPATGGTINHIGTLLTPTAGKYKIIWRLPHVVDQENVKFKIRLVDAAGNVRDAAGGASAAFTLSRSGAMASFVKADFNDFVLHHDGEKPDNVDKQLIIDKQAANYDSAYLIGAFWRNPDIEVNGNDRFPAFANGEDDWALSIRVLDFSWLKNNANKIEYFYTSGFGHFVERPGPMIVLKESTATDDNTPPTATPLTPQADETDVPPEQAISLQLSDDNYGVDIDSIVMRVDGTPVTPVINGPPTAFTLVYTPTVPFDYEAQVTVAVDACDYNGNCMTTSNYSFTTQPPLSTVATATVGMGSIAITPELAAYPAGTTVTLTATADAGWLFQGWSGTVADTANPLVLTITQNHVLTATFIEDAFSLTVMQAGSGFGQVTTSPALTSYPYGSEVRLEATAAPGSRFDGWSGDVISSSSITTVTITGDQAVTATFTLEEYTLDINSAGAGSGMVGVEPTKTSYLYGDEVTFTAMPNLGSRFDGWSGDLLTTSPTATLTVTGNQMVTATFGQETYTVNVNQLGDGTGTVDMVPPQATYLYGDKVTITANPALGSSFGGWQGAVTGNDAQIMVTITESITLNASFLLNLYTMTLNAVDASGNPTNQGRIIATSPGNNVGYVYNEIVTLTTVTEPGWRFVQWHGSASGTVPTSTVTIDGNEAVTATFDLEYYTIAVEAVDQDQVPTTNGAVSISPPQNPLGYVYGETVTVTATATSGWEFVQWDGVVNGNTVSAIFTVQGDGTVTAIFTDETYSLSTDVNELAAGRITVTPEAPFTFGQVVTLTAVPVVGWEFIGWSGDLSGTENPAALALDGHKDVTAEFAEIEYTVEVNIVGGQGSAGGKVEIIAVFEPPYYYGDMITLKATPNPGYRFVTWVIERPTDQSRTPGGEIDLTNPTLEIEVTEHVTYLAQFQREGALDVFLPIVISQ